MVAAIGEQILDGSSLATQLHPDLAVNPWNIVRTYSLTPGQELLFTCRYRLGTPSNFVVHPRPTTSTTPCAAASWGTRAPGARPRCTSPCRQTRALQGGPAQPDDVIPSWQNSFLTNPLPGQSSFLAEFLPGRIPSWQSALPGRVPFWQSAFPGRAPFLSTLYQTRLGEPVSNGVTRPPKADSHPDPPKADSRPFPFTPPQS